MIFNPSTPENDWVLTSPYSITLESNINPLYPQYSYSPYCYLYIYQGADKEGLSNNQEFLQLVIISSILLTLMCDSVVIL